TAPSLPSVLLPAAGDAVRALGLLAGGVRADRRTGHDGAGVDRHVAVAGDRDREAVHPSRRRAGLLLADLVVLRPVARALEPLAGHAGRHAAAEVWALLVERHDATLLHAGQDVVGVDGARLGQGVGRVVRDPGTGRGSVEEALAVGDPLLDVVEL